MEATELESEGDIIPAMNAQSQTVRKNISLKLKGKGRGGRGGKKGGRSKKEPTAPPPPPPPPPQVVVKIEAKDDDDGIESEGLKFDEMDEDIFKLEAPTFTTIDRGPPEPVHRNVKLRWDFKVNLIGTKMMNPLIHCCNKCTLPILSYGRMIPCKHVFCYDCALKAEKLCPRCEEKVSRVEQVGLGQLFMCIFGAVRRNGSDGCCRTYLSQRDLQAHINHRHLRQPIPSSTSNAPGQCSATSMKSSGSETSVRQSSSNSSGSHHHANMANDYRLRNQARNQGPVEAYRTQVSAPIMQPQLSSFPTDVHRAYERPNLMSAPPPIMSPYSMAVVSQSLSSVGVPPPICVPVASVPGTVAVPAYGSSPIPVVSVAATNVAPPSRTNLITVPIHDDSSAGIGTPPADYIQNYHQRTSVPPPVPQPNYLQQMVVPPYSGPPPVVSYPTTYCTQTVVTSFPPHYPPPPIYSTQLPPPTLTRHQAPPRFMAPPPQRYVNPQTQQAQYEDHSHMGSPQYPPPAPWSTQPRTSGPPPQHNLPPPLGPPPTARPPFY